ncbi:MAG: AAA family ATPase [bacterium]|nr:AAA family ATPase [bacterium]
MALKPGFIQQTLSEGNGWWRDSLGWSSRDHDLRGAREAPYDYTSDALSNLAPGGLYVLRGPRRAGKSVQVKQAISTLIDDGVDPRRIVHMSVDGWAADDLVRLVRATRSLLPAHVRRYWFIDEITTITDGWPHRIKWLRDNDPWFHEDTVVLTGSSSSDLSDSIGILAGRRGRITDADRILLPMGFRTFVELTRGAEAPTAPSRLQIGDLTYARLIEAAYVLVPWLNVLVDAWDTYLWVGGFHPAVTAYMTSREEDRAFEHDLFEIVDRDALRRASWSRTETAAFLHRMTKSLSSLINQSSTAGDLGVAPPTVKSRIGDLCAAFILWPCHRENRLRPQLRSQKKFYFTDPVYTRLVPGAAPEFSVLSEQQLGMALLRNIETGSPGSYLDADRVLYHRTPSRTEIDFVGPDFGDAAIESKYVDGRWRATARTIQASKWRGIVATRTVLDLESPELLAVPTAMLAWLLDT